MIKSLHQPWWPAIAFGALTLVCLAIVALVVAAPLPRATSWPQHPGGPGAAGVIAALYTMSMLIFPERLGSAASTGLTVTAAIVASLLLDHMGWVGFERHPAGLWRLVGAAMMVGGLALVAIF